MILVQVEMLPADHKPLFQKEVRATGGQDTVDTGRIIVQYEFSNMGQVKSFMNKVQHRTDVISVGWEDPGEKILVRH